MIHSVSNNTMKHSSQPMELKQQSQQSLEYRLPPLFECHYSTVRYIRAGFYLDAIHSIMEGFSSCQASLVMQSDKKTAQRIDTLDSLRSVSEESTTLVIDRNPMHFCSASIDRDEEELLVLVMLYNLALSYHLLALSETGQDNDDSKQRDHNIQTAEQIAAILRDAFHLYEEACIRLHNLDPKLKSSLHSIPALHSNMRHAKILHLQSKR